MLEAFEYTRLSGKVMSLIDRANAILNEYQARGLTMTLRMLHYQFVARGLYANTVQNYKKLGHAMTVGRRMGLVDWSHLEDHLRALNAHASWNSPQEILYSAASSYREDLWRDQAYAPEVWIEKDALMGVIAPACNEFRAPSFACRGYVSVSAQYEASKRFQEYIAQGREPIVFHMGDHDPSGLDMTRDNRVTFELLTREPVEVVRLALNYDQIQQFNPPPNPAKMTDSRAPGYVSQFGRQSWELDALPPDVLNDMVANAIRPLIDTRRWQASLDRENENRERLDQIAANYDTIIERLDREG